MEWTEPRIVDIPSVRDPRGSLSVLENPGALPFDMARVYWLYDVPSDAERDGHAMLSQSELIVALTGSFEVITRTAAGEKRWTLDRNYRGLYMPPLTWREIDNFTSGATALVISSDLYDEADYIRDEARFQTIIESMK